MRSALPIGLAAVLALAMAACRGGEPRTDAEKLTRGKELALAVAQRLAGSKDFRFSVVEVIERDGKPRTSLSSTVIVRRPDRLHIRTTGDRDRELWYDSRRATLVMHADKVFAQAPMPDTLDRTLDAIIERYDMPIPIADILYSDPARALFSANTKGGWVGIEDVNGAPAVHLAFGEGPMRWEIWVPETGVPLPVKARIAHPERREQPRFEMTFSNWNLARQDADAEFDPKVPLDYEGIAMIQRAVVARAAQAKTQEGRQP